MYNRDNQRLFNTLKRRYTPISVRITNNEVYSAPKTGDPFGYRDFIARKFKEKGLEITRFSHNYDTKELGMVFLAGDSEVNPFFEVWGLVGYNLQRIKE